jgi:hypothetical protein
MWQRKGLILQPNSAISWMSRNTYAPTADVHEEDGFIRIYFSGWGHSLIGRVGYVDVEIDNPREIIGVCEKPVLEPGRLGTFDEHGVSPACVLDVEDKKHLYYFGFQRTETPGVHLVFAGLAISSDNGKSFERYSQAPILPRIREDPWLRSSVSVMRDGGMFRMWYTSALGWMEIGENAQLSKKVYPSYIVRHTTSLDGISWSTDLHNCIELTAKDEFGIGRPCVIKEGGKYRMWYSLRSIVHAYRIGYAESDDGLAWQRSDDIGGMRPSPKLSWDSEMVCFGEVALVKGKKLLFYNGNRHGMTGIGFATWRDD